MYVQIFMYNFCICNSAGVAHLIKQINNHISNPDRDQIIISSLIQTGPLWAPQSQLKDNCPLANEQLSLRWIGRPTSISSGAFVKNEWDSLRIPNTFVLRRGITLLCSFSNVGRNRQYSSASLKMHKNTFPSIHSENRCVRRRNGQIQECVLQFGGAKNF